METTFRVISATFLLVSFLAPAGMIARAEDDSTATDETQATEEATPTLFEQPVGRIGLRQPCAYLPRNTQENINRWNACRKLRTLDRRQALKTVRDNAKERIDQAKTASREQQLQARETHEQIRNAKMEARRAWQQDRVKAKDTVKQMRLELWNKWKRLRKTE